MKKKYILIAEVGCNHCGDFALAKKLILAAKRSGADYVKFQKRDVNSLPKEYFNMLHPNPYNAYGDNYAMHRKNLEFSIDQHLELYNFCEEHSIKYSVSTWDYVSAKELLKLNVKLDYIKIPSACNLDKEMIDYISENFDGELHISTGMTSNKELEKIINHLNNKNFLSNTIIYHSTSSYPCKFEDLLLNQIKYLSDKYGKFIKGVGFSGHHLGIAADIAALTLGARYIERHFTLDRTLKGTDHAASLEPIGLEKLSRDLQNVWKSLSNKEIDILESEIANKKKLKFIKTLS